MGLGVALAAPPPASPWVSRGCAAAVWGALQRQGLLPHSLVRWPDCLADGLLGDTQARCDFSITHSCCFELLDDAQPLGWDAATPRRHPSAWRAAIRHRDSAPDVVAACAPSNQRPPQPPLGGVAGVDQEDHRVGLGHRIMGTVVVHRESSHNDDPVLAFVRSAQRALMLRPPLEPLAAGATLAGWPYSGATTIRSGMAESGQVLVRILPPQLTETAVEKISPSKKADRYWSAPPAGAPQYFQGLKTPMSGDLDSVPISSAPVRADCQ
jgi:hypothetical protein